MKKYEVITEHGSDVFHGTLRECKSYLKQALQKGSPVGYLAIAPTSEKKYRCGLYVVLHEDGSFQILTHSDFRRLNKKFWLCRCFYFGPSYAPLDVNDAMRLWIEYRAISMEEIHVSGKSLFWPGFRAYYQKEVLGIG